jgi:hypothetical protein
MVKERMDLYIVVVLEAEQVLKLKKDYILGMAQRLKL